ncbi:hypothetical protein HYD90_03570 [Mycoplasmopsis bovis]|nr:hypothetical protein [Mycoplasmopsis bovis]QQH36003.1 hypothetical protein HYD90_03570 [Mycoplasmopsis bovis]
MLLNFMYSALSDVSLLHCLSGSFISDDRTKQFIWCKNHNEWQAPNTSISSLKEIWFYKQKLVQKVSKYHSLNISIDQITIINLIKPNTSFIFSFILFEIT